MLTVEMPFGRYKNKPLADVPGDYLRWALGTCKLSSGLQAAVAEELQRRGLDAPPAPPARPVHLCREHPGAGVSCHWCEDSVGRRHIRAQCKQCGRKTDGPPLVEPYVSMANATNTTNTNDDRHQPEGVPRTPCS
jgi:uncharacterized protein (DUF3820 family)